MPAYDSLILSEKTAVIFEVGTVYTKCGFAGETSPRFIVPTEITLPTGEKQYFTSLGDMQTQRKFFIKFFHNLYYRHLLVNPKDRRVVIIEGILCSGQLCNLIADVLYNHFEIPSALFAPSHLFSLYTLGISTALVLDCGYREASVIPVCEGFTLLNAWQAAQLGSQAVFRNFKDLLMKYAELVDNCGDVVPLSSHPEYLKEYILEDLTVRVCFISPASRAAEWKRWLEAEEDKEVENKLPAPEYAEANFVYHLGHAGDNCGLRIPSFLREQAVECLFCVDNDQVTLATLLLRAILSCPIDTRKNLAQNIVLIGGTVNIPGFIPRLVEELNAWVQTEAFSKLSALKNTFKIHEPPANANYVAWLGGAIFGALDCLPAKSLERTVYLGHNGKLPDWTTAIDVDVKRDQRSEITR